MSPEVERQTKRQRLLAIMERHRASALVLSSATTLGWYLDGARTHVSLAADPVLAVRVTADGDEVWLTDNEAGRLVAEELPADVLLRTRRWYEPAPVLDGLREGELERELWSARWPLLPVETDRYRALGTDAAEVLTAVLAAAGPEWSERRLAAEVAHGLVERGADPLVVLVGGDARAGLPHPLPTDAAIGRRALVVVCARRAGLITNLSRSVSFGAPTPAETDRQQGIYAVERAAFAATRPGARLSDVLAALAAAYELAGFGPDHWVGHHQGGMAGYAGRDPRATPDTEHEIAVGQAFAWNPWAPGAKVEDTVLLTDGGLDVLTVDPAWPTVDVAGLPRPAVLVR